MNNLEAYFTTFTNNKIKLKGIIATKGLKELNIAIPVNILNDKKFENCNYSYNNDILPYCNKL